MGTSHARVPGCNHEAGKEFFDNLELEMTTTIYLHYRIFKADETERTVVQ